MGFAGGSLTLVLGAALLAMSAIILLGTGSDADGVATWVRAVALFLLAYVARPLRQLWRSEWSSWLLRHRRALGVSMAFSHLLHLIGIVWYFAGFERPAGPDLVTILFGGAAFVDRTAAPQRAADAAENIVARAHNGRSF